MCIWRYLKQIWRCMKQVVGIRGKQGVSVQEVSIGGGFGGEGSKQCVAGGI